MDHWHLSRWMLASPLQAVWMCQLRARHMGMDFGSRSNKNGEENFPHLKVNENSDVNWCHMVFSTDFHGIFKLLFLSFGFEGSFFWSTFGYSETRQSRLWKTWMKSWRHFPNVDKLPFGATQAPSNVSASWLTIHYFSVSHWSSGIDHCATWFAAVRLWEQAWHCQAGKVATIYVDRAKLHLTCSTSDARCLLEFSDFECWRLDRI